ncbi:structural maintenance of chromosome protein 4, partial [Trypanosoma cruzi]
RAILGDHISIPRCLCPPVLFFGRSFLYRRRGTNVPRIRRHHVARRIWDEGVSGVVFDLRCAYQCWQQEDEEQVKLAFDNLVEWIGVLEGLQDPTDRFMNMGRSLLNTFRMQLTMASDPGIRLSKLRARVYTAVHQTDNYAKAVQPLVDRRETQRTLR